jgi:hypothetical protein
VRDHVSELRTAQPRNTQQDLIAEDGAFAEPNRYVSEYLAQLTIALLPDEDRSVEFISERDSSPEEAVYIASQSYDGVTCMLVSVRLERSYWSEYARYANPLRAAGTEQGKSVAPPGAVRRIARIPVAECNRLEKVWAISLSRLQTCSDWLNSPADCRSPKAHCESFTPPIQFRFVHFANAAAAAHASGYLLIPGVKGRALSLINVAKSLISFVRSKDEDRQMSHESLLNALESAERAYAIR